jgi:hypothetical protein
MEQRLIEKGIVPPVGKIDQFLQFHVLQRLIFAVCFAQKPVGNVKNGVFCTAVFHNSTPFIGFCPAKSYEIP